MNIKNIYICSHTPAEAIKVFCSDFQGYSYVLSHSFCFLLLSYLLLTASKFDIFHSAEKNNTNYFFCSFECIESKKETIMKFILINLLFH